MSEHAGDRGRDHERDADGYAELRSYAAIGDGRTVALIARDGRVDWLPLPDLDSPPVFGALLDAEHGGYVALAPTGAYRVERSYVPGTNVLSTTFHTEDGSVRITDALNTGIAGRLPWAELARRVDGLDGHVELRGAVVPGTCLNTTSPWIRRTRSGEAVLRADGLTMAVRTLQAARVEVRDRHVDVSFRTSPGSRHLLGLVATEREPLYLPAGAEVDAGVDRTVENWSTWLGERRTGRGTGDEDGARRWDGDEWADAVQRSVLLLKLMIYAPTGAVAAAPTTSLPESDRSGKNWDYRYAWVRDTAFTLGALFRFGLREEIHGAMSWMLATIRRHGPHPRVFYALNGDLPDDDVVTRDVPGWRGHAPVRTGNRATGQLQLGVFGDLFGLLRLYVEHGNVLDEWTGRTLALVADTACDTWRSKDSGMWELATERHYTTSKMGCWKALTDAVALAGLGEISGDVERWRSEAGLIRAWIDANAWSDDLGAYVWYPGSQLLDASVVLHAISGFDRGPRMSSTLDALRRELGDGPYLYRYSGAADDEAAFVACSYWMVSALHLVGRRDEARALLHDLDGAPNDVGVLAEMIDPASGAFAGNLPQALSHLAQLHAVITLTTPDDDERPDAAPDRERR